MNSKSQIVATIGPATKDKEIIRKMIEHQMDVVRLNFSWGTLEEHASYIHTVREVATEFNKRIPIIQDLSGPRIQGGKSGHHFNESISEILTETDKSNLAFGLEQGIDYVAMSYVGNKDDILLLRDEMKKFGKVVPIIAKIERMEALEHIDEIIEASDVIMIARGDLGNEVPLEKIPFIEKMIIEKCKIVGKPVITATQMLISMVDQPFPTRAEVTDVTFAILMGSDAVMLSDETATGHYPVEAVIMMEKIIIEAEQHTNGGVVNILS
ncbi:MAG: pyruvate kinase [Candidatus Paceibacterota bacterium]|jgi:pyruvate kinase